MNKITAYTVFGFLDSGKTGFINRSLQEVEDDVAIIQFEQGEEDIAERDNLHVLTVPFRSLGEKIKYTSRQIYEFIESGDFTEVWFEVNGLLDPDLLDRIVDEKFDRMNCIRKILHFERTVYVAHPRILKDVLAEPDPIPIKQIIRSDAASIRTTDNNRLKETSALLKSYNPDLTVRPVTAEPDELIGRGNMPSYMKPVLASVWAVTAFLILRYLLPQNVFPVQTVLTVFLGIILQSFPFLLLGVLISSLIQIIIPQSFIERRFPKHPLSGILFAGLTGFFFPVCDCASIPVFRSLVKKGIPVSAAVTFMVATPVINPIVIWSTYTAFNGDWRIVFLRVLPGFLAAVLIGFIFFLLREKDILKQRSAASLMCSAYALPDEPRWLQIIHHAQGEFLNVAKYLLIGAFLSATVQTGLSKVDWLNHGYGTFVSIIIMMAMGFLLSLCSSSDAMVAKSFSTHFPNVAILGFLIFGPMLDIKNVILLSGSFRKRFILHLIAVVTVVCLAIVSLMALI